MTSANTTNENNQIIADDGSILNVEEEINKEDHEYVIEGLRYWLNNKPKKAESFFKSESDSTAILAGYAFVLCMNGVISYEADKIDEAQCILKLLEKRCTTTTTPNTSTTANHRLNVNGFNWLSNVRYRIFGNVTSINMNGQHVCNSKTTAQLIEEQIILADVYMSMAILTFLTQDITGLMKGSWLLRKAWKIYQKTYTQLYEMYVKRFGNKSTHQPIAPLNYSMRLRFGIPRSLSQFNWISSSTSRNEMLPLTSRISLERENNFARAQKLSIKGELLSTEGQTKIIIETIQNSENAKRASDVALFINNDETKTEYPSRKALHLELINVSDERAKTCEQNPKTCPSDFSGDAITNSDQQSIPCIIDTNTLKRLMGAASFGYGIFQLITSLLPNKLLKIISIFGFEGNRDIGISCLMFARLSSDMRAILATLALLWFYTFGTQLFHNEDGYAKEKIEAVANLLTESNEQYHSSAIFLFFQGRLERMKANAQAAVECFEKSYRFSAQTELKLLCLHEIAWCKLIQLDFFAAMKYFNELRLVSVFSKAFYTYMTAICQGAIGNFENLSNFRDEMNELLRKPGQKQTHILTFIQNRIPKFPSNTEDLNVDSYWKYLCYEMLFLWSALSNVSVDHLNIIVQDCSIFDSADPITEPMVGLCDLLLGGAQMALKNYQLSMDAYNRCICKRLNTIDEDMHVSAFAHYELATLKLHCHRNDVSEIQNAKQLLQNAQKIQNYDLENRLCVQIQQELKKLT